MFLAVARLFDDTAQACRAWRGEAFAAPSWLMPAYMAVAETVGMAAKERDGDAADKMSGEAWK
jgi:hypothetical protein